MVEETRFWVGRRVDGRWSRDRVVTLQPWQFTVTQLQKPGGQDSRVSGTEILLGFRGPVCE